MDALAVLTRPEGSNESLARRLAQQGVASVAMPALALRLLPADPAGPALPADYDLVVFVSGQAARFYLGLLAAHGAGAAWPASTLAAAVGQASAQALRDSGLIPPACVVHPPPQAVQDSESLWAVLQPRAAALGRVLIVCGQGGREWLGRQFEQAGARVTRLPLYRREPAPWPPGQCARLRRHVQAHKRAICLLTSSQGAQAFFGNARTHGLQGLLQQACYVVIHQRIASRLQSLLEHEAAGEGGPAVTVCAPNDEAIGNAIVAFASL